MRVHELAKQLEVDSNDILDIVDVSSHLSNLSKEEVEKVKKKIYSDSVDHKVYSESFENFSGDENAHIQRLGKLKEEMIKCADKDDYKLEDIVDDITNDTVGKKLNKKDDEKVDDSVDDKDDSKPKIKEQFVPQIKVGEYLQRGYKVDELKPNSGFSVDPRVRDVMIGGVKGGRVTYMTKELVLEKKEE